MGVVHLRGEGGVVWRFDEPLPRYAADQLRQGRLVKVADPDSEVVDETPTPVAATRPAQSDAKSEWIDYAVANGTSVGAAEAMTKAELIDQFGSDGSS